MKSSIEHLAPVPKLETYPILHLYCVILRVVGLLTIASAAWPVVGAISGNSVSNLFAVVYVIAAIVAGIVQVACAELLTLLVRLQANAHYMCERLYALEQNSSVARRD